jgi:Tfp pilus assembly protein PilF
MMIRLLVSAVAFAALAACSSDPMGDILDIFQPAKGQAAFTTGLKQYEDGEYAESAKNLQSALHKGLGDRDKVAAYKHLAFIHCVSGRERQCRDEFRRALAVDPAMDLAPAEAGHPIWGPIFRAVKAGR